MLGKRERPEDAYGWVPQDPRDMVKTALSETQPPVMQGYIPRYSVCCGATLSGRLIIRRSHPPQGGRWGMTPLKGADEAPTSCYHVSD